MIVAGTILLKPKDSSVSTASDSSSSVSSNNSSSSDSSSSSLSADTTYKDGTFSGTGDFNTPGGNEEITVTITISNGAISNSSVTGNVNSRESQEYLQDFIAGYKDSVDGKSVATLRLSRVAGSSLTTIGFNNALDAIRSQAKA